jgi:hypothetical protein
MVLWDVFISKEKRKKTFSKLRALAPLEVAFKGPGLRQLYPHVWVPKMLRYMVQNCRMRKIQGMRRSRSRKTWEKSWHWLTKGRTKGRQSMLGPL